MAFPSGVSTFGIYRRRAKSSLDENVVNNCTHHGELQRAGPHSQQGLGRSWFFDSHPASLQLQRLPIRGLTVSIFRRIEVSLGIFLAVVF